MVTSSQSDKESRTVGTDTEFKGPDVPQPATDASMPADGLQPLDDAPGGNIVPFEPTPREVEEGANESVVFYEDATGKRFPDEPMDEETARVLYDLHVQRQDWTQAMEDDARATLQLIYPNVGGSKTNGPL